MATHYFGSHRGGIEIVAEKLFEELSALNQEIVWMASDTTPPPEIHGRARAVGLPVFNFVETRLGIPLPIPRFRAVKRMRNEVRQADVLVLHDCLYLTNIAAFLYARSRGLPVLIVQHIGAGAFTRGALSRFMKIANSWITRPMLRRARQVVFISETVRSFFSGVKLKSSPMVVFNGVNTEVFWPASDYEKAAVKQSLGLPSGKPMILFVGRFVEWKGLPVLKHLVKIAPDYMWVFAGSGPLDPARWGADNVRVFSGLRGSSLADLYRASDLFVLPSLREGFPLVIQEALACGLPVVCGSETITADPAMTGFVHGVDLSMTDERISAINVLETIREVLRSELDSPQVRARRDFVLSRYSWRRAAETYLEIAAALVPGTKHGRVPLDTASQSVSFDRKPKLGQDEASS
jgi:glycosyltransferase involved in cell wall biosynthesis